MTQEDQERIREEERIAQTVQESLQAARAAHQGTRLPDPRVPYMARMRVRMGGRQRDILLGACTYVDARRNIRMIDWQSAPLARVFFAYRPGEEFAEDIGERELCGHLEQQSLVTFADGHLVRIATPAGGFCRDRDGQWVEAEAALVPRLAASPGAIASPARPRGRGSSPLARLMDMLDGDQRAVVEHAGAAPLLVSGSAGTGKTTAALLRLARWQAGTSRAAPALVRAAPALVIVPEHGLARAIRARLDHLDIAGVDVHTFDDWVTAQARRVFRKLPARARAESPPEVAGLKRHPALHALLARFVDHLADDMAAHIDRALVGHGEAAECFRSCPGPTLLDRLSQTEARLAARAMASPQELATVMARERARLHDLHPALLAFVGDRVWLNAAQAAAGGEITGHMVETVLRHTRAQLSTSAEREYAHVDADRLRTLDERGIDDGTTAEHAGTIDVEDYALLLELLRLATGAMETPHGRLRRYGHILIDEAQELAPVELAVLAAARRRDTATSLAGDPAQHISDSSHFTTWDAMLARVGLGDVRHVHLRNVYRCSRPVATLAHRILGPLAPADAPEVSRDGEPVALSVFPNAAHRAFSMSQALQDLADRVPHARVAVIARKPERARQLHRVLQGSLDVRLVESGDFLFEPGIDITDVSQVKGLEFDIVIVPDATAAAYPDTPQSRRLLHVAVTRALHALWVIAVGAPSPVL